MLVVYEPDGEKYPNHEYPACRMPKLDVGACEVELEGYAKRWVFQIGKRPAIARYWSLPE